MIELDVVTSTNSFIADYRPLSDAGIILVTAEHQTAGRGQTGNSWESEASRNLLFSLLLRPAEFPASRLFLLSEAMALSIRDAISAALSPAEAVAVKWPNDVYVGDRKIAGILMENDLRGSHVGRCIIGCGVNINQTSFLSDAPNPVSLRQLLGRDTERSFVLDAIVTRFRQRYSRLTAFPEAAAALHADYVSALYRRRGLHLFREPASDVPFLAEIADVEPSGHLLLRDGAGKLRRYAFKEVSYVLG